MPGAGCAKPRSWDGSGVSEGRQLSEAALEAEPDLGGFPKSELTQGGRARKDYDGNSQDPAIVHFGEPGAYSHLNSGFHLRFLVPFDVGGYEGAVAAHIGDGLQLAPGPENPTLVFLGVDVVPEAGSDPCAQDLCLLAEEKDIGGISGDIDARIPETAE